MVQVGKLIALLALAVATPAAARFDGRARELLEDARRTLALPGMAVAIWQDGGIVAEAAAGERALGSGVAVRADDPFHIGSIAKPFTAILAARLVARGHLAWDDTVGEKLGPLLPRMLAAYRGVTIAELLAHRGGIVSTPRPDEAARLVRARHLSERRMIVAGLSLAAPPVAAPGSYHYSNYSYVIAAAMIEQATGRLWEELVAEEVLAPLGLASAGFGPPGNAAAIDAPRGHIMSGAARGPVPPNSPLADNPPFARPAGGLHMSMRDLALFGADQLFGARGQGQLLDRAGYRFLHARRRGGQGTGWALGPGGALHHDGSNRRWFALLRVIPEDDLVIAVAANAAGDEQSTREGFWALSERLRRELR